MQGFASLFGIIIVFGFPSLYATLVCVACSRLEKLRLALLDIRQPYVISEQTFREERDQQKEGEFHTSEEMFRHMQNQVNACIRHHQNIKRCGNIQQYLSFQLVLLFMRILILIYTKTLYIFFSDSWKCWKIQ